MKLTNEKAIKMLKKARLYQLEEMLDEYPDDEVDERDDFQMIADEGGYWLSMYDEDTVYKDDLDRSKRILSETNYGKFVPILSSTFRPKYSEWDIQASKNSVNEYNRLKRLIERLRGMGYYSRW